MTLKELLESKGITLPEGVELSSIETELVKMYNSGDTIPRARLTQEINKRNEISAQLAEAESKVQSLEAKISEVNTQLEESKQYKAQLEEFKNAEFSQLKTKHQVILDLFANAKESDKNYSKIQDLKAMLNLKDGDYTIEDSQSMKSNLEKYELVNKFGGLETQTVTPPDTRVPGDNKGNNGDVYDPFKIK